MAKSDWIPPVLIGGTIVILFFGAVIGSNKGEADKVCYTKFPIIYTWDKIRPELDKIWKDKFITRGECFRMNNLYLEARKQAERNKVDEKLEELGLVKK